MSQRLLHWLNAPDALWLDPSDTPLALGALTVQIAGTEPEARALAPETIDAALAQRFDLTAAEAREMRQTCERVAAGAPAGDAVAELLCRNIPEPERRAMARTLLQVCRGRGGSEGLARAIDRRFGLYVTEVAQTPTSGP